VGFGADDHASGTAAVLEIAQALASARPSRSILCCFFSAEEDGLKGSAAFCRDPAVPPSAMVAMLNLDMVGRGPADSVVVLGTEQNPALEKLVLRAQRQKGSGIKKFEPVKGDPDGLWQRSDHYSFHEIGVPSLFFFEALPISDNEDYHTWRDTIDKVDQDKITRTARLCFQTAWLLATDEERPPAPAE
jgi:Zn-dependent M28 family amino/carboxypeptidase